MKKKQILPLLIIGMVLLFSHAQAQKEGAIWYFGHNAGLDFTRHYPKPLTDGQVYTREGVATISSAEGDLLFYTDGSAVWNKNHQVMDNGFGLFGNTSSTQSSIIVPTPLKQYEYYIFTVDVIAEGNESGHGLNWSLVDMVQNNRQGRVFPKNQQLLETCVEKITVVKHDNEQDYWIIAHGWNNNRFYVYKLTKNGVSQAAAGIFQQDVGEIHENTDNDDGFNRGAVGYMKSSPKGDYLALAIESKASFELFKFDNKTGKIEFLANLPAGDVAQPKEPLYAAYGVEFSPISNYLYGSTRRGGMLYRWDLSNLDQTAIRNSVEVLNPTMQDITCGAMQLAFNGKIYICFAGKQYLGVINSPTQEDCKFVELGASLIDNVQGVGGKAYYGLPTFLPDFFRAAEFYFENTCQNDTTLFYLSTIYGLGGEPKWTIYSEDGSQFVGNATINHNTFEGTYQFKEAGNYIVELQVEQNGVPIKQKREITIHSLPELNFPDTTILCAGKTVVLNAGDGAFYKWSDNVNLLERYRTIATAGQYSVHVTHNNGCVKQDTTLVVQKPLPVVENIITTKASCGYENGSITIFVEKELEAYEFDWKQFPDSSGNKLQNLPRGVYEVDIISTETGCALNKKITISETGAPDIAIIPSVDGAVCPGTELSLTAEGAANYEWTYPEGDTTSTVSIQPYHTETYVVEGFSLDANNNKCSGFQQITVEVFPYDPPELGPDLSLCEGEEKVLDGLEKFEKWEWNNGETGRYVTISESIDNLILLATDINGCTLSDTINLEFKPLPTVDLGVDRTLCRGTDFRLDAGSADQYLWNTGDTIQQIAVPASGHYSVMVTKNGCSATDDVIVRINDPDSLRVDSVSTRNVTCFGAGDGEIRVFSRGEGNYYEFSLDEGFTWKANQGFFEDISPGSHQVLVREDSACQTQWPEQIEITEPEELLINYKLTSPSCENCQDGQIALSLSGGNPPYNILWSNFETARTRNGLKLGNYSVSVTDSKACKSLTTIILEMGFGALSIPNAFTPNGDGYNDAWIIKALDDFPDAVVTIFNRAGKIVFTSPTGYPDPWDGRSNEEYLPMGTYYYLIKLNDLLDPVSGSLSLIR